MHLFDLLDRVVDGVVETPGKVLEKSVETVARVPEATVKTVVGGAKGVEKAIDKLGETLDDIID